FRATSSPEAARWAQKRGWSAPRLRDTEAWAGAGRVEKLEDDLSSAELAGLRRRDPDLVLFPGPAMSKPTMSARSRRAKPCAADPVSRRKPSPDACPKRVAGSLSSV